MNREQFQIAKSVILQDANISGAYFDGQGGACAVGGLFMSLHPEIPHEDLLSLDVSDVEREVAKVFGLTMKEISDIEHVNDSYDMDDIEDKPDPDDYFDYIDIPGPDGETMQVYSLNLDWWEQVVEEYDEYIASGAEQEELTASRRSALIEHLDEVVQDYDEGVRAPHTNEEE